VDGKVIVKTLMTGSRLVLKSVKGYEILRTKIYQDKFICGFTQRSLLLGNLENCYLSEIEWINSPKNDEKFYFLNDKVFQS